MRAIIKVALCIMLMIALSCCGGNRPQPQIASVNSLATQINNSTGVFKTGNELKTERIDEDLALVGKTLWFVPNAKSIVRTGFAKSTRHEDMMMSSRLYPTAPIKMIILDKIVIEKITSTNIPLRSVYQVKFSDESVGFIDPMNVKIRLFKYTSDTINKNTVSTAKLYLEGGSEYFFQEDPDVIKAKIYSTEDVVDTMHKSIATARKKAEIDNKKRLSRGGVSVGMSKGQVLSSSWGKPVKVNSTIVKGRVTEQWVYQGSNYLYFDNENITAIQTSK